MRAVGLALAITAACTPVQARKAKTAGKIMSLSGVGCLIAVAFGAHYTGDSTRYLVMGLSSLSAIGIGTYAAGDLSAPQTGDRETTLERHHRWAKILTDRAYGYARDGRCWRVRNIEGRVRVYDRELHAVVFMKDPEILECLTTVPVREEAPELPQTSGTPIDSP